MRCATGDDGGEKGHEQNGLIETNALKGRERDLTMKSLLAVICWVLWCTLHSTLVAPTVTETMRKKLGNGFRFYRLFYNAFSIVALIPLVSFSMSIRETPFFRWEGYLVIVKYLLVATSLSLFVAGARHYSMSQLFGIRQIKTGRASKAVSEVETLDTSGVLGMIRHPWYIAGILLVWAADISLSTLVINIVIVGYFVVGTLLEERKLVLEFGDRYREYQKNVSMFIPYKWLKAKMAGVS
jgi:protein-S-isoprenylcysteine O-methyltransferase Ste14